MIIFRKFDYDQLKAINPILSPLFIYSFLGLAYTLFLKMFIIILDFAYVDYIESLDEIKTDPIVYFFNLLFPVLDSLFKFIYKFLRELDERAFIKKHKDKKITKFFLKYKSKIQNFLQTNFNNITNFIEKMAFIITGVNYHMDKKMGRTLR
jgi:hypothetical protein